MIAVLAVSLVAPDNAPARTARTCSIHNAQRVLDTADLTRDSDWEAGAMQHAQVRRLACGDITGDGRRDLLLTVDFPGPLALVNWLAFRRAGKGFKPVRFDDPSHPFGYHYVFRGFFDQGTRGYFMVAKGLSLRIRHGAVRERLRRYRDEDENDCCPSGGYMTNVWAWNGRWLTERS